MKLINNETILDHPDLSKYRESFGRNLECLHKDFLENYNQELPENLHVLLFMSFLSGILCALNPISTFNQGLINGRNT